MPAAKPGMIALASPSTARTPDSTMLARLRGSGAEIAVERPRLTPPKGGGLPASWQEAQAAAYIAAPASACEFFVGNLACTSAASPRLLRSGVGGPDTPAIYTAIARTSLSGTDDRLLTTSAIGPRAVP